MSENIIDSLVGAFDDDNTMTFNDADNFSEDVPWITTGSPTLDLGLMTYGYPPGILEIRGESRSGKTTLSLHAMANCVNQYGDHAVVCILSSERRDNKAYAKQIGVDVKRVILRRIRTIEDASATIKKVIRKSYEVLRMNFEEKAKKKGFKKDTKEFKEFVEKELDDFGLLRFFFVWDSLGQTISRQELDKAEANEKKDEEGQAASGAAARALSQMLKNMLVLTDDEDLTLFIINRPYDKVRGTPGKVSYGGKAIMLYPSIRLECIKIQSLKVGDDVVGQRTVVDVLKSDYCLPEQKFYIEIGFGLGIVLGEDDIKFGIEEGILEKFGQYGASFMKGKLKWKSRKELYQLYKDRNPMLKVVIQKMLKVVHTKVLKYREEQMKD